MVLNSFYKKYICHSVRSQERPLGFLKGQGGYGALPDKGSLKKTQEIVCFFTKGGVPPPPLFGEKPTISFSFFLKASLSQKVEI